MSTDQEPNEPHVEIPFIETARVSSVKQTEWHTTAEEQPGGSAAEHGLVMAMYVNGLTAIPAIVAPEIVRAMPTKYPKWRYLVDGQDFIQV
ncbi:MAG: hypothetical protein JSS89_13225 [Bacteroidetes bacterium]|nr:hypothetical protein [Bacteroidota bacterium]